MPNYNIIQEGGEISGYWRKAGKPGGSGDSHHHRVGYHRGGVLLGSRETQAHWSAAPDDEGDDECAWQGSDGSWYASWQGTYGSWYEGTRLTADRQRASTGANRTIGNKNGWEDCNPPTRAILLKLRREEDMRFSEEVKEKVRSGQLPVEVVLFQGADGANLAYKHGFILSWEEEGIWFHEFEVAFSTRRKGEVKFKDHIHFIPKQSIRDIRLLEGEEAVSLEEAMKIIEIAEKERENIP
ncbi:MAG: hypothetical protein ACPLPS_11025 [bacterium]